MANTLKVFNQLLDEGKIPAIFEKLDTLSIQISSNVVVLNRLRMEFIMGLSGIAYLDFIDRLRVFIKMVIDKQAIAPSQINQIGKLAFSTLSNSLKNRLDDTPKIIEELILIETNKQTEQVLKDLLDKWNHHENIYQITPNAKFMTLKTIKIQIKNEVLTILKPQIS